MTAAPQVEVNPREAAAGRREAELRRALRARGLRCTTQRLAVIELLAETDGHVSAPEIFGRLRGCEHGMDLTTVYRTLATLVEVGLVHSVALPEQPAFYGLTDPGHHHALCPRCARVAPIPRELLDPVLVQLAKHTDLPIVGASLTVVGLCAACQTEHAPSGLDDEGASPATVTIAKSLQ